MNEFEIRDLIAYEGSNGYLPGPALAFRLNTRPGIPLAAVSAGVVKQFPKLAGQAWSAPAEAYVAALGELLKLDLDLCLGPVSILPAAEGEAWVAAEYLDEKVARAAVYLAAEWLSALIRGREFDIDRKFRDLQADFDKSLYGGPTLYSLIEAGLKRGIPVHYLYEENQFQWGYGRKQVRGRSTTFHTDSIKDTEFTTYKDMCKDFLQMCGFPTPVGRNCFTEREIEEEAARVGFPVVVKPVAGHKGQGVTTGIQSAAEARKAFRAIVDAAAQAGAKFDGAIVEKQIYGTDHRLLAVKGKFVAALQRIPAYVDGNGTDTIGTLIEKENSTPARIDNARSPLCRIKADDNLLDFLKLQNRTLQSVPKAGERVFLRRVANISAGGVSINVTDRIHPRNVQLVEDIAGFFQLTCLGIDVLAEDIAKPWDEGNFGIIEINAAPGVFMHLAPAIGGSIDVPGRIMESHFPKAGGARIPIVSANKLSAAFCRMLGERLEELHAGIGVGCLTAEGVTFHGRPFYKHPRHDQNVRIILRNPRVDFAVFTHSREEILEAGMFHRGADVVILDAPEGEEKVLSRDLLPGGCLIEVKAKQVIVHRPGQADTVYPVESRKDKDKILLAALAPLLPGLIGKYE